MQELWGDDDEEEDEVWRDTARPPEYYKRPMPKSLAGELIPGKLMFRGTPGNWPVSIQYSAGIGGFEDQYGIIDDEDYTPAMLRAIADHMEQWHKDHP